jgi:mitochondrial division protein 1
MRSRLIEKLHQLEIQEAEATDDLQMIETKLLDARELEDVIEPFSETATENSDTFDEESAAAFLSQSTYGSLSKSSANKARKRKAMRRRSAPILHQHYEAGSLIKAFPAHNESITTLDFDFPFGTMVTASIDDTVRVWNLATGRCQGLLEGHIASVRCLQLEETLVATGSTDAKIKLWDLGVSDQYSAVPPSAVTNLINKYRNLSDSDDERSSQTAVDGRESRQSEPGQAVDCCVQTLDAHVGEVTALHFINQTLVSGSQDRTIRQWDLTTGRLLQTMDILGFSGNSWTGGTNSFVSTGVRGSGDFVGALQCFDQGLAAGTADGIVRFWDLRTGAVARELTGHTGPVTALQFDDLHLVSGSLDRSVRIWDLRTGSIHDAYAYEEGITDLHFDARRIVAAAGEPYAKVYDRVDGRHWGCGEEETAESGIVKVVKNKEGYLVGGRSNGMVGIWSI